MDIHLNGKFLVCGGGRGVDSPVLSLEIVPCAALSSWWMLSSSVPISRRCRHFVLKLFLRMVFAFTSDFVYFFRSLFLFPFLLLCSFIFLCIHFCFSAARSLNSYSNLHLEVCVAYFQNVAEKKAFLRLNPFLCSSVEIYSQGVGWVEEKDENHACRFFGSPFLPPG